MYSFFLKKDRRLSLDILSGLFSYSFANYNFVNFVIDDTINIFSIMTDSGFTTKDMLQSIMKKLDDFIERDLAEKRNIDSRIDLLEQHRSTILSNISLLGYIIGVLIGGGGIILAKIFIL